MNTKLKISTLALVGLVTFFLLLSTSASALSLRASCVSKVSKTHLKDMYRCARLSNRKKRQSCYVKASKKKAAGLKKCAKTKK